MSTIQIKPELLHALTGMQGQGFTVAELTAHYLKHPKSLHEGKKPARQFIYRNIVRMIKAGLMEKLPDDGGWPRYKLTKAFETQQTKASNKKKAKHPSLNPLNTNIGTKITDQSAVAEKPVSALRERLGKHRSEMLCALGEAEEYEALCKDLPEFGEEAKSLYAEARERSALLLGKIKALESLLSSHNPR